MPPRHDGTPRTAKYQEALDGGHDVLVLVSEVWGGFSPEAVRFLGELAQARGDRIDFERESATWSTTSFMSYHGQLLSLGCSWVWRPSSRTQSSTALSFRCMIYRKVAM